MNKTLFMSNLPEDSPSIYTLARLVAGQLSPASVEEKQWEELIALALDQGLGGMLLWSLRQAGWAGADESRWQSLVSSARRSGLHSLLLEKARRRVAAAFDQAGIPAIWLKGIALAHTHYPEPHLRPMVDLDVLVPLDRLSEARGALLALGFMPAEIDFFELSGLTEQARHHESFMDRGGRVTVELHFRLLVPALERHLEADYLDWFWAQTEELALDGPAFRILKPDANLLYLCAHTILQDQGAPLDLLHLLDLHLLVAHSPLDWDLIVERAVLQRWTFAVEAALKLLPGLFGTRLPAGLLRELQERRPADERPPLADNPLGSTRRWDEWRSAYMGMAATQRLRLIWRTFFPPSAFLRRQYHLRPGQSLLLYYLYHFLDGCREVARGVRTRPTPHRSSKSVTKTLIDDPK